MSAGMMNIQCSMPKSDANGSLRESVCYCLITPRELCCMAIIGEMRTNGHLPLRGHQHRPKKWFYLILIGESRSLLGLVTGLQVTQRQLHP